MLLVYRGSEGCIYGGMGCVGTGCEAGLFAGGVRVAVVVSGSREVGVAALVAAGAAYRRVGEPLKRYGLQ